MKPRKGFCGYKRVYYGDVTVSEKGQIAIPVELRERLEIKKGDKLIAVRRKDNKGFTMISEKAADSFFKKFMED